MKADRRRSLLIVKRRIPFPLDAGTDIVSYGILRALKPAFEISILAADLGSRSKEGARSLMREGVDVHLVPCEKNLAAQQTLNGALFRNLRRLFLGLPNTLQMDRCSPLGPALRRLGEGRKFDLVQFEYWNMAEHRSSISRPSVLLNHDAWFRTAEDMARYAPARRSRVLWRLEARTVRRHESRAQRRFEWRLFLSDEDRRALSVDGHSAGRDLTIPVPFIFQPEERVRLEDAAPLPKVVFVGGMTAPFNVDAALFFTREIWPEIRRRVPQATLGLVGDRPPPEVLALSAVDGVRVEGYVPDLRAYLRDASVAVSPCRIGTGMKVKVAEAMAAGLPVVGTTVGLSGYQGIDGPLVRDKPRSFAEAIVALLQDEEGRKALARRCLDAYRERLWLEAVAPRVVALYEEMASAPPRAPDVGREGRANGTREVRPKGRIPR